MSVDTGLISDIEAAMVAKIKLIVDSQEVPQQRFTLVDHLGSQIKGPNDMPNNTPWALVRYARCVGTKREAGELRQTLEFILSIGKWVPTVNGYEARVGSSETIGVSLLRDLVIAALDDKVMDTMHDNTERMFYISL